MPTTNAAPKTVGGLTVHPYLHPMGCRGYLIVDEASKDALAVDPHLDLVADKSQFAMGQGWRLRWVVDTHTHADHPSGSCAVSQQMGATRVAHAHAKHEGVTHLPDDGEVLELGDHKITIRHTPGHTPDHMVLISDGALFSGDTLFIGSVARADFLGGDAGQLFDSIHEVMLTLPDDTVLYPGHDYAGNVESTIGAEKQSNPWLQTDDRDTFVKNLTANKPAEPANMAALLDFNRQRVEIPMYISAGQAIELVKAGGASSVIDVRTDEEVEAIHIPGARHIELETVIDRIEDVLATPAPRLMLCKMGQRAEMAQMMLKSQGVEGVTVIDGGILAYRDAGGDLEQGEMGDVDLSGGCCAALPPE